MATVQRALEKRTYLFASVVDDFRIDGLVDEDAKKVYVDDANLLAAIYATLKTMPEVIDFEQAVSASLGLYELADIRTPLGSRLWDITDSGGGWAQWEQNEIGPDGNPVQA